MRILVVGMGLIGGSICKSIKAATSHAVYGCDIQPKVLEDAAADGAIDGKDGTSQKTCQNKHSFKAFGK